ncbi:MAG: prolipoprotein diacylglyceryl transferase [Opitutaceae bacterium]|nr:prolipoprotein diacylglyceryl transferase [Opitutaceae bacterium]
MPLPFAHWVHDLSPFIIRFGENFGLRWYGLAYVLGFLAAGWMLLRYHRAGRSALPPGQVADCIFALVLGVLIGGRLGYFLLYDFDLLAHRPFVVLRVWEGGMAYHGGLIGATVALWWFARSHRLPFLHLGDVLATTVPAGLLLGRIANFINGELWGRISTVPWAVIFPKSVSPGTPVALIPPRHPSQLYEAALEGALLLLCLQWRFWKSDAIRTPGRLSGEFLIGYAAMRIVGEVFREPDEGVSLILGLSRGTFYSLFLVLAGAALILRGYRQRTPDDPTPASG